MRKSKPQFKTVDFSERSSDDFRKYIKFLMTHQDKAFKERFEGMSDDEIEEELRKQLEKKITKWVDDDTKHYDTIYPEDTKYGRGYKMLVSGEGQRVIFYEIYKDEDDNLCAKVHNFRIQKILEKILKKKI